MDDFNVYDMAEELAERQYHNMTMQELLDAARVSTKQMFMQVAAQNPDAVVRMYENAFGVVVKKDGEVQH